MTCQQHIGEQSRHSAWPDGKVLIRNVKAAIFWSFGWHD